MADSSINLSPVDFTGKTVSCSVYIPLASGISYVNLTLINTSDKQELLNQIAVTPGQWNTLNFVCSAGNVNYADPGATFTGIQKLRLRFETGTASAALAANIDAINW